MKRRPRVLFTPKEIKKIYDLWGKESASDIAKLMNRSRYSILYLVRRLRTEGYDMPYNYGCLKIKIKQAVGTPEWASLEDEPTKS